MHDPDETQPATTVWPFKRAKDVSAQLVDLRERIVALEHSDREKSATLEAHRLEISELKAMAAEQRAKNEAVLAKLDLGFTTLTTLLKGERRANVLDEFR